VFYSSLKKVLNDGRKKRSENCSASRKPRKQCDNLLKIEAEVLPVRPRWGLSAMNSSLYEKKGSE
jgi:hypothetical protein